MARTRRRAARDHHPLHPLGPLHLPDAPSARRSTRTAAPHRNSLQRRCTRSRKSSADARPAASIRATAARRRPESPTLEPTRPPPASEHRRHRSACLAREADDRPDPARSARRRDRRSVPRDWSGAAVGNASGSKDVAEQITAFVACRCLGASARFRSSPISGRGASRAVVRRALATENALTPLRSCARCQDGSDACDCRRGRDGPGTRSAGEVLRRFESCGAVRRLRA